MNREELKAMGLTDEQVNTIMASHGTVVNATKDELATVTTDRDSLKEQITERDTQLNDLSEKVKDNEVLTSEINQLKETNATSTQELQDKLDKQAFTHKLENTLSGVGAHDINDIIQNLDLETIKLDGDKLLNLDDQVDALKESKTYLFKQEENQGEEKPSFTTGNHQKGNTDNDPFSAKLAQYE